jgi:hypothetical protein
MDSEIFCINIITKKHITALDITNCLRITDACIPVIASLPHLRTINVSGSGITLDGINKLMKKANLDSIVSKNLTITPYRKDLFHCTK